MTKKTLAEVAADAIEIYAAWNEAADRDEGFDAGEFSGPASYRAAEREVRELAERHGFSVEEVDHEISRITHEQEDYYSTMPIDPYGYEPSGR